MTEGAYIHMNLEARDHQISFSIENNFEKMETQQPQGIGIENLKKRLNHMYPNRHQLTIEEEMSIYKATLNIDLI